MTVSFPTLGCKLNQAETEALAEAYSRAGFRVARPAEEADIVIVNSCTVTARSDAKSRRALRRLAAVSPAALVVLTGCYAEVERDRLAAAFEAQSIAVVPQSVKARLKGFARAAAGRPDFADMTRGDKFDFLRSYLRRTGGDHAGPFDLLAEESFFRSRAFLKIQDGCDGGCAYCRVPLARGRAVSLDFAAVSEKLRRLAGRGAREIVFTGVNISAYRSGETDLAGLIEYAAGHSARIRFRLSSLEPDALTPRLIDALAAPAVCPHFHLSAQSGSAAVLERMRRRYGPDRLREGAAALRRARPDAFLAADVIVGFPGETGGEFEETYRLLAGASFNALHVFPFSPRPGTAAFSMPGRVDQAAVRERVAALLALGAALTDRYLSAWRGKSVDVILERKAGPGAWLGSSGQSVKCRVEGIPPEAGEKGGLVLARVSDPGKVCRAEFIENLRDEPVFNDATDRCPRNSQYGKKQCHSEAVSRSEASSEAEES
jgi:threonylcarbamoyladenosine tRNA methylthiotransferase MtaB